MVEDLMSVSRTRVALVAVLVVGGSLPPEGAGAAPSVRDGAPTPEACAAFGYGAGERPEAGDRSVTVTAGRRVEITPPRTYNVPTIPPLPVPPVQQRLEKPRAPGRVPPPIGNVGVIARPTTPNAPFMPRETERYPAAASNPIRQVAEAPVSTFSIDVDTASYANVRRFLTAGHLPPADAVRVEELVNYFDYAYPRPIDASTPFAPFVAVAPSPWSADRQILHIGLQAYAPPQKARPPLNLVVLIDTSGSMRGPDRLPLARQSLNLLIDELRPQDRLAMVAYAGSAGAVLAPTGGREKLKMRCALEALEAGGTTAGGAGLALAYRLAKESFDPTAVNRIVLMPAGDFNVGVADPAKLKDFVAERRKDGVYLSVYGFGRGNYNDVMMQTLAQNGNGTAGYVDGIREARKFFQQDLARGFVPVADDVKIQVEFNPAAVKEYRLIGYETRMLARQDFNNDQVDAGEVGAGAAVTALYEIAPAGARRSVDPLRYQPETPPAAAPGQELAFLKIRYKRPGEARSQLLSRPITPKDQAPTLAAAPAATRWAVAVAGFGQLLRKDPWLERGFSWPQIAGLAQGATTPDHIGLRSEFIDLVEEAAQATAINER
jgi:Ca-activated chloride channel family protein